jgi:hypothetical protein
MPISAPTDIAGCRVWVAADEESGFVDNDPVGTALNQGSSGGNPTAAGSTRPTFKTNILNGKPAYRFDGVDDGLVFGSDPRDTGEVTLYAVVIPRGVAGAYDPVYISGLPSNGQRMALRVGTSPWGSYVSASGDKPASTTLVADTPYMLGIVGSGAATASFRLNGAADGSWSGGEMSGSNNAGSARIGVEPASSRWTEFDLLALVLYDTLLSNADRDDLEAYLTATYLTAPSPGGGSGAGSLLHHPLNRQLARSLARSLTDQ